MWTLTWIYCSLESKSYPEDQWIQPSSQFPALSTNLSKGNSSILAPIHHSSTHSTPIQPQNRAGNVFQISSCWGKVIMNVTFILALHNRKPEEKLKELGAGGAKLSKETILFWTGTSDKQTKEPLTVWCSVLALWGDWISEDRDHQPSNALISSKEFA